MVSHSSRGAWGIMLNKQLPKHDCCLADIIEYIDMDNPFHVDSPVYLGGPVERGRVCVIHSSDWSSASTQEIVPGISITTDISILSAIAGQEGPEKYRLASGLSAWSAGQLDGEMKGVEPWTPTHRWLTVPATVENVLDLDGVDQWQFALKEAVSLEVKELF